MEVALAIDVPDIVRSFPTGSCWPLVGDVIFIFGTCCCDDAVVLFPAVVVFYANADTLLQRAKIKIPKAHSSTGFPFSKLAFINC